MSGHDADLRLPAHPSSVGKGRRVVTSMLNQAGRPELAESAELLVSEVLTNALVHAGTTIGLSASVLDAGVRVEVSDGSPTMPVNRGYTTLAATGRGLNLVMHMADRWGVEKVAGGKKVWFEIDELTETDGAATSPAEREAGPRPAPGHDRLAVELLNMPLLLHAAWQPHVEALLREYLLVGLDDSSRGSAVDVHAAAAAALTLLRDQVPTPDLGTDPTALMAATTEPAASHARLRLSVPAGLVANFKLLDETIEAGLQLADAGELLTAPTQPELRALRTWLCREVEMQALGESPTPWSPPDESAPPPVGATVTWDLGGLTRTDRAVLAADDTNRIIAVSVAAAELLGYDDAEELVGRRIVTIVPERYRQAHVAGFTLHLVTGRDPLLGKPVVVPALRRDGSELMVELTVTLEHLLREHRLFVATMQPVSPEGR